MILTGLRFRQKYEKTSDKGFSQNFIKDTSSITEHIKLQLSLSISTLTPDQLRVYNITSLRIRDCRYNVAQETN